MNVGGRAYRTIWGGRDGRTAEIIDQTRLPDEFVTVAYLARKTTAATLTVDGGNIEASLR